ncbi:hypothetical protein K461DRAFT_330100 [Myriangium duriaei CBS 260.36]|uniref:Integral membrane protein n=1 Tax=Myriangium duriaei CBS 260.36 TaxID=1168546 RepID=A0A9P4IR45_9PEZI|nr:hypothetical protein K461DRAFT_330100 [Myriangium duriaei CBS 260.36]
MGSSYTNSASHHRQPLRLDERSSGGPLGFLNPTRREYGILPAVRQNTSAGDVGGAAPNVRYKWSSRNNRKGRHAIVIKQTASGKEDRTDNTPASSTSWRSIGRTVILVFFYYPVWDVSWLVAFIFTWGSIVWVINSFFVFLPLLRPSTEFPGEIADAGGWSAWVGATVFEVGSVLLLLEAVNENRTKCFGWAIEQVYEKQTTHHLSKHSAVRIRPDKTHCEHHHPNKRSLVGARTKSNTQLSESEKPGASSSGKSWTWFPSSHDLRTHYIRELGFWASAVQLFAASVFWISGFTAIPGIQDRLSSAGVKGAYWFPQVLGGFGFVVSGFLFMLEVQEHWAKPALGTLGWHIGFWNFIGGWGFFLCPCFGFNSASWAVYQSSCSTFWGSWAFLIGSVIQLYESQSKYPVEIKEADEHV